MTRCGRSCVTRFPTLRCSTARSRHSSILPERVHGRGIHATARAPEHRDDREKPVAEGLDDASQPDALSGATALRAEADVAQDEQPKADGATFVGLRYSPFEAEGDAPELSPPDADERGAARSGE